MSQQSIPPLPKEAYDLFMKELVPLRKEIFPLWQDILTIKLTMDEAIRRKTIKKYEYKYMELANKWISAKEKTTVLERLISPDDPEGKQKIAALMTGYLEHIQKHEERIAKMMDGISSALRDKKTEANFLVALYISVLAITISVISFIISVFV